MRTHPEAKGNPYQRRLFVRRVLEQGRSAAERHHNGPRVEFILLS
jgi:hypothetical protein